MIQTIEMRIRFLRTTVACGRSARSGSSAMRTWVGVGAVPDQAWVEGLRREHGQHHHCGEEQYAGTGRYRHQWLELHQGHGEGVDKYVEHRPSADELHHAIESG